MHLRRLRFLRLRHSLKEQYQGSPYRCHVDGFKGRVQDQHGCLHLGRTYYSRGVRERAVPLRPVPEPPPPLVFERSIHIFYPPTSYTYPLLDSPPDRSLTPIATCGFPPVL